MRTARTWKARALSGAGSTRARVARIPHAPGTFCWTDLAAPDMDAAGSFYAGLFGWSSESAGDPEQTGGYTFFKLDGQHVAAYGPPGPGEPPSWRPYVAVESAEQTAARVRDAGGELLLEPMDVFGTGHMAVFRDLAGAVCCAWQPATFSGADVIRERGALGWVEHATNDLDGARRFYGEVFGWSTQEVDAGYALWKLGDEEVGGLTTMAHHPPGVPPHWLVNFVVANVDETAARAGNVRVPPTTVEIPERGSLRFAVLADPNGAVFGIFAG